MAGPMGVRVTGTSSSTGALTHRTTRKPTAPHAEDCTSSAPRMAGRMLSGLDYLGAPRLNLPASAAQVFGDLVLRRLTASPRGPHSA
jgi:hypothetical protein